MGFSPTFLAFISPKKMKGRLFDNTVIRLVQGRFIQNLDKVISIVMNKKTKKLKAIRKIHTKTTDKFEDG